jgi:hypothetical protein
LWLSKQFEVARPAATGSRQRAQLIGPGAHRVNSAFTHRPEPADNADGPEPQGALPADQVHEQLRDHGFGLGLAGGRHLVQDTASCPVWTV